MKRLGSFSWENRPKNLDLSELQCPWDVLKEYQESDDLRRYLEELPTWRESVMSYGSFNRDSLGAGEDLLMMYQGIIKVAEALCVMNELMIIGRTDEELFIKRLPSAKRKLRVHSKCLTAKECSEPFEVVKEVFKVTGLQKLRDYLWEFLRYGLSQSAGDEMFEPEEVERVFDQIEKLISVAYLLTCQDR